MHRGSIVSKTTKKVPEAAARNRRLELQQREVPTVKKRTDTRLLARGVGWRTGLITKMRFWINTLRRCEMARLWMRDVSRANQHWKSVTRQIQRERDETGNVTRETDVVRKASERQRKGERTNRAYSLGPSFTKHFRKKEALPVSSSSSLKEKVLIFNIQAYYDE